MALLLCFGYQKIGVATATRRCRKQAILICGSPHATQRNLSVSVSRGPCRTWFMSVMQSIPFSAQLNTTQYNTTHAPLFLSLSLWSSAIPITPLASLLPVSLFFPLSLSASSLFVYHSLLFLNHCFYVSILN